MISTSLRHLLVLVLYLLIQTALRFLFLMLPPIPCSVKLLLHTPPKLRRLSLTKHLVFLQRLMRGLQLMVLVCFISAAFMILITISLRMPQICQHLIMTECQSPLIHQQKWQILKIPQQINALPVLSV